MPKRTVGIFGAATPAGVELMRVLSVHPMVDLVFAADEALTGALVREHFPGLSINVRLPFVSPDPALTNNADLVFCAHPLGEVERFLPELLKQVPGKKVIDLSAWLRPGDADAFHRLTGVRAGFDHLREQTVYGITWRNQPEIAQARLVAMPGPAAQALVTALAPLASRDLLHGRVHVHATVGRHGASPLDTALDGDAPRLLKIFDDAQILETTAWLARGAQPPFELAMVTELVAEPRTVLLKAFVDVGDNVAIGSLDTLYRGYYEGSAFVSLLSQPPQARHVVGSNRAHLYVRVMGTTACIAVALDALGRGSAQAAVECANLMLALPDEAGLMYAGGSLS